MAKNTKTGIFLGTGASEMIPNQFCSCEVCSYARSHPEEQRLRSAFLYDENTCIDFGPDIMASSIKYNTDLTKITDFLQNRVPRVQVLLPLPKTS